MSRTGRQRLPSIGLCLIVRDAAEHIERCIDSVLPYITTWTIVDTGSVDDTRAIIRRKFKEAGIDGTLVRRKWKGFSHNRTQALALARHAADYTLMLDADLTIEVADGKFPALTESAYKLPLRDRGLVYALPLLTCNKFEFRYEGAAHAALASDDPTGPAVVLPEVVIIDHGGGGNRPGKIEGDRDALALAVAQDPTDARSWFYLAQSYRDLGQVEEAIRCYRTRAEMGGWQEEHYVALWEAGRLLVENVSFHEGAPLLLEAFRLRPSRAEALRALSNSARAVADKIPYPEQDTLFIEEAAYTRRPSGLRAKDVSAIIVTRGDVDLEPVLATLPYEDVVVWDNSKREDLAIYGRYAALAEAKHPIVYFQDDDVLFTAHEALLAEYEPGVIVANMDGPWVEACGYHDNVLVGAGAICDRDLPGRYLAEYLAVHPLGREFLLECDFALGVLAPGRKVDLGYIAREFSDDDNRLYRQPWQAEAKAKVLAQARAIRDSR